MTLIESMLPASVFQSLLKSATTSSHGQTVLVGSGPSMELVITAGVVEF